MGYKISFLYKGNKLGKELNINYGYLELLGKNKDTYMIKVMIQEKYAKNGLNQFLSEIGQVLGSQERKLYKEIGTNLDVSYFKVKRYDPKEWEKELQILALQITANLAHFDPAVNKKLNTKEV